MSATPVSFLLLLTVGPILMSHSDLEHGLRAQTALCVRVRAHARARVWCLGGRYAASAASLTKISRHKDGYIPLPLFTTKQRTQAI